MSESTKLFNEAGVPKRIMCFKQKRGGSLDCITVVFTQALKAGYPRGTVLYRAMSEMPFSPIGYALWGEDMRYRFRPGGSRINFSDLPKDCQELVLADYKALWKSE